MAASLEDMAAVDKIEDPKRFQCFPVEIELRRRKGVDRPNSLC